MFYSKLLSFCIERKTSIQTIFLFLNLYFAVGHPFKYSNIRANLFRYLTVFAGSHQNWDRISSDILFLFHTVQAPPNESYHTQSFIDCFDFLFTVCYILAIILGIKQIFKQSK